jgi:hypothetical protein
MMVMSKPHTAFNRDAGFFRCSATRSIAEQTKNFKLECPGSGEWSAVRVADILRCHTEISVNQPQEH